MIENDNEGVFTSVFQAESPGRLGKVMRILFHVLVALLSAFLLLAFWDLVPGVVLLWLPDSVLTSLHPDFTRFVVPHRVHQAAMHAILWGLVLGVTLQLYHSERRVAPLLQALTFMLTFLIIELAVGQPVWGSAVPLLVLALVAALHPRSDYLARIPHLDRAMLVLVALAVIPWLIFAIRQVELARLNLPGDTHDQMEHWNRMAVFATLMIGWGLIGATDLPGWRLTTWTVAYGSVVFGLQSLAFPHQASALPTGLAIAATGWSVAYLVTAERRWRSSQQERSEAPA